MSSIGDQIRMDWLLDSLKGKDISNCTIIFGTCEDCKHNVKNTRTTTMCDKGHRFFMREPSTFCCADFVKRGNENESVN